MAEAEVSRRGLAAGHPDVGSPTTHGRTCRPREGAEVDSWEATRPQLTVKAMGPGRRLELTREIELLALNPSPQRTVTHLQCVDT